MPQPLRLQPTLQQFPDQAHQDARPVPVNHDEPGQLFPATQFLNVKL